MNTPQPPLAAGGATRESVASFDALAALVDAASSQGGLVKACELVGLGFRRKLRKRRCF